MKQLLLAVLGGMLALAPVSAQVKNVPFVMTGDLKTDILAASAVREDSLSQSALQTSKKSVLLAPVLSAAVPGAGEFYTGNYLRGALFVALEATLWIVNVDYNKKGDNQTNFFQGYADQHWSVVRYANWINTNLPKINSDLNPQDYAIPIDPNTSKNPWDRVDWNALNRTEEAIGGGFSHHLPAHGEQQYYELIGKYPQFSQGWDDSDQNSDGLYYDRVSARFLYYSDERGKANDFYNKAATAAKIIVVNHVLSAIDAALCASSYNKVHSEMSMQTLRDGTTVTLVPTLRVSVSF